MPTYEILFKEEELERLLEGEPLNVEIDEKIFTCRCTNSRAAHRALVCPKCNTSASDRVQILLSSPLKYEYLCRCGYKLKYFNRENCRAYITQLELNEHFTKGNK